MQYRLTKKQRVVLDALKNEPQLFKGTALLAAKSLVRMGFAEQTQQGLLGIGGYFRLTALGAIQRGPIVAELKGVTCI